MFVAVTLKEPESWTPATAQPLQLPVQATPTKLPPGNFALIGTVLGASVIHDVVVKLQSVKT